MLASEGSRPAVWMVVALLPLASAARATDTTAPPARPPSHLSASDWQRIRAAHAAARQARFEVDWGFLGGIDAIEQQAYLKASNTNPFDQFGEPVAVSDDTVVVAAPFEDSASATIEGNQADNSAPDAGAVYVFVRTGTGWSQQAYLKASNTDAGDVFGCAVSISGDTLVVGAYGEDSSATGVNGSQANNNAIDSGAAYVFVRSDGAWSQQAYLKASNAFALDEFGYSVAVSGDMAVVGAWREDSRATGINGNQADNGALNSGAAYIFVRNSGVWSQQAYLKASNTDPLDRFGKSVAVSGDTVVVSSGDDSSATGVNGNQADHSATAAGAAYVFVLSSGVWSQQAYLKASNTDAFDEFGRSIAISFDTIIVGAPLEDSNATGVNGDQTDNSAPTAGAAYVFVRSGGNWSQQAYLKASNAQADDWFGKSVAISGNTAVSGAFGEDSSAAGVGGDQSDNTSSAAGAAYLFVRSGGSWSQQTYLKASNTGAADQFGDSVALSGEAVVVGARLECSNATGVNGDQSNNNADFAGAAYVFALGAAPLLGDMNCNGVVNVADIAGFVLALTDPPGYAAAYPDCDINNADLNMNGQVNVADIGLFVALLTGG